MRLAALVLAAGRSRRFGPDNKLLADLDGTPIIARALKAVTTAGFGPVLVVTGADHEALLPVLAPFGVQVVPTQAERYGMGTSIAAGVAAVGGDIEGLAIMPGDMPLITPDTLRRIAGVFALEGGRSIVHATTPGGAQRNPVIWPRTFFGELARLGGDRGAKSLIRDAVAVPIPDEIELLDIDDASSLAAAHRIIRERQAQS